MHQIGMFDETFADLPIFSGSPSPVLVRPKFSPKANKVQPAYKCPTCHDTGELANGSPCLCTITGVR